MLDALAQAFQNRSLPKWNAQPAFRAQMATPRYDFRLFVVWTGAGHGDEPLERPSQTPYTFGFPNTGPKVSRPEKGPLSSFLQGANLAFEDNSVRTAVRAGMLRAPGHRVKGPGATGAGARSLVDG
jgi:hypothetical protein